jgi:bla regulator protein BlaR1
VIPAYLSPLANHIWQSTIITGVAALLTLALRHNSARVRYWLWFAAAVKFLIPFSLLVGIGHQFEWRTPPAVAQVPISSVAQISMPFVVPPAAQAPVSNPPRLNSIPAILFSVWLVGFAFSLGSWVRSWWRVRSAVRMAIPADVDLPTNSSPIRVLSSPTLIEPAVFGIFRPVLLLPGDIANRMAPEQLQAILVHELCHVRRRDNLTTALYMMAETLFWFYPVLRWIGKRLLEERERACDEQVLEFGSVPVVYAEGILCVCKHYVEPPVQCASGITSSDLKKRIRAILDGHVGRDLNLAKKVGLAAAGVSLLALPLVVGVMKASPLEKSGVTQTSPLTFEVSTVKLSPGCETRPRSGQNVSPGRLNLECITLHDLIENAYGVWGNDARPSPKHVDVQGGPSWVNSDHYSILATASGNASRGQMNGPMLRTLLEERFKLKVHRESKTVPVYALTLTKGQLKLKSAQPGRCVQSDPSQMPPAPAPGERPPVVCGRPIPAPNGQNVIFDVFGVSIADFADGFLSRIMDRVVIDRTGQLGLFDFHFEFTPDASTPLGSQRSFPATPPTGLSIFTALEEQLGLKLESTQGPVDVIVIDYAERPSEN